MARFVKTRDREIFNVLFTRYKSLVINHIRRFVKDRARAEELAQDVFIRVYTAKHYEPRTKFTTWLYRIATNIALNELRRGDHRHPTTSLDTSDATGSGGVLTLHSSEASPEVTMATQQLAVRLTKTLDALPPKQRAAFLMVKQDSLTYEEVASALETSVSAVKSLVHRALEALRKEAARTLTEPARISA